jgi:hypothetical protein
MPKVPPKVPLGIEINAIALKGFTKDSSGGSSPVTDFDGSPLYCHVTETAQGSSKVNIVFDLTSPTTFTDKLGVVQSITVTFDSAKPPLTFNPVGAVYTGGPLGYFLEFAPDLSTATLNIEQPPAQIAMGDGKLGLIILGGRVTSGKPRGYFVDVPVGKDFESFDAMTIYWPPGGGLAGPIGGGVVPPGGP